MSRFASTLILLAGFLMCGALQLSTAAEVGFPKPPQEKPGTLQMIIKFKNDSAVGPHVQELFLDRERLAKVKKKTYLEQLNELFHLKSIDPLFGRDPRSLKEVMRLYPERSKRIAKTGEPPDLGYTYLFVFEDTGFIIEEICDAYQDSPDVEYAHPNSLIHKEESE